MQTWRSRVLSSRTRRRRVSSMPADAKPYCCSTDAQTVIAPATTNTLHHFFTCHKCMHDMVSTSAPRRRMSCVRHVLAASNPATRWTLTLCTRQRVHVDPCTWTCWVCRVQQQTV